MPVLHQITYVQGGCTTATITPSKGQQIKTDRSKNVQSLCRYLILHVSRTFACTKMHVQKKEAMDRNGSNGSYIKYSPVNLLPI